MFVNENCFQVVSLSTFFAAKVFFKYHLVPCLLARTIGEKLLVNDHHVEVKWSNLSAYFCVCVCARGFGKIVPVSTTSALISLPQLRANDKKNHASPYLWELLIHISGLGNLAFLRFKVMKSDEF